MHDITVVFPKNTISYKRLELSLKLHSRNGDSIFVRQVYFVHFFARMCKVRVYNSVAVQSFLKNFILSLVSISFCLCDREDGSQNFRGCGVYICGQ